MEGSEGTRSGREPMNHHAPPPPTEDEPAHGVISEAEVLLSHADHWVDEDGVFVFVSTEFDLMGQGATFELGLQQFYDNAEDLMGYLRSLIREGRATDDERTIFALLSERFDRIRREQNRELEEITKLRLPQRLKRRHRIPRTFSPSDRQRTSSEPLNV